MSKKDDKPKKPLTGLAAALVKAGKLDEKDARKLTAEQRREDKALGREGVEQREAERQAALAAQRAAEAEAQRALAKGKEEQERSERVQRAVRDHLVSGWGGNRRFFFVARGGRIPFFDVSIEVARALSDGRLGIVEAGGVIEDEHAIVEERALVTLHGVDPELVRFWNRPGAIVGGRA